jgi:hypothetical protein
MGKSLEEIASRELWQSYAVVVNGEFAYRQKSMLDMFYKGVESQKEKSIEVLSSVLDNWVLDGDRADIIAEFAEMLNNEKRNIL